MRNNRGSVARGVTEIWANSTARFWMMLKLVNLGAFWEKIPKKEKKTSGCITKVSRRVMRLVVFVGCCSCWFHSFIYFSPIYFLLLQRRVWMSDRYKRASVAIRAPNNFGNATSVSVSVMLDEICVKAGILESWSSSLGKRYSGIKHQNAWVDVNKWQIVYSTMVIRCVNEGFRCGIDCWHCVGGEESWEIVIVGCVWETAKYVSILVRYDERVSSAWQAVWAEYASVQTCPNLTGWTRREDWNVATIIMKLLACAKHAYTHTHHIWIRQQRHRMIRAISYTTNTTRCSTYIYHNKCPGMPNRHIASHPLSHAIAKYAYWTLWLNLLEFPFPLPPSPPKLETTSKSCHLALWKRYLFLSQYWQTTR